MKVLLAVKYMQIHKYKFGFRTLKASDKGHLSAAEESAGSFLAKAIQSIEEKTLDTENIQNNMMPETGDCIESGNFNVTGLRK